MSRTCVLVGATTALLCLSACEPVGPEGNALVARGAIRLNVLEESTFLARDANRVDVRTNHFLRVQVSRRDGSPVSDLGEDAFTFEQNGEPATAENLVDAEGDLAKVDVSLCLDNSSTVSPYVDELRASASDFVATIESHVDALSVYVFSTTSYTYKVAEYRATEVGEAVVWELIYLNDDPLYDLDPEDYEDPYEAIDSATQVQLDGTALYQVVDLAIASDDAKDDIIVLFSDGKEQGSAPGSKASALEQIELHQAIVFGIGIGDAVEADLDQLAEYGGVFIADSIADLAELFDRVANHVRSIYSLIYSAPDQSGAFRLTLSVEVPRPGSTRTDVARYRTGFLAGVDLAYAAYSTPVIPQSRLVVRTRDERSAAWVTSTWTAMELPTPIPDALVSDAGMLHFQTSHQPSNTISEHTVYGEGERDTLDDTVILTPERAARDTAWRPFPDASPHPVIPGGPGALVSVITGTRRNVRVPSTRELFRDCIQVTTWDTSVDPPEIVERSYWARGIGQIFAEGIDDRGRSFDAMELLEHDVPERGFRD